MLTRPRYRVQLETLDDADPATTPADVLEVEVSPGDQFRAEFEAQRQGLGAMKDAPMNHTAVWVWCALVRAHGYVGDYQTFVNRDLYAWESLDDPEDVPEVDPTGAGPSGPA